MKLKVRFAVKSKAATYATNCRLCGRPSKGALCDECYAKFTSMDKGSEDVPQEVVA